jgi:ABC-type transport system involved in multi-copper enzyme maturation permease subunit
VIPFALRQFRAQGLWGLGALVVVAVVLAVTGPHLVHVYDSAVSACRAAGGSGPACINDTAHTDRAIHIGLMTLVLTAPALIGMFWGAPLVGRELETGTFRLAWTQGIPRPRWLATKLTVVGGASALAGAALGLMGSWWASPIDALNQNRFSPSLFALHGFVPGAYALFAFVLGTTTGVLFRRTFPAMAVTLVGFIGSRLLVTYWVRPYLLPQTTKTMALTQATFGFELGPGGARVVPQPPQIPNAWVISTSIVNGHGQAPTQSFVKQACSAVPGVNGNPISGPLGGAHGGKTAIAVPSAIQDALQHCMANVAASYHIVVRYQPASHFWTMQILETLVFAFAAAVLGALSFFWVRRRLT